MIFPYKYNPHPLDRLHKYIEHTVLNVWCKATPVKLFAISMLQKDFNPIVLAISKNKNDYLLKPIMNIYNICAKLTPKQRKKLADGFTQNNNVSGLCKGSVKPLRYTDIEMFSKPLSQALNPFFKNLYTKLLGIQAVKTGCGDLKDHYQKFMIKNGKGICPFCGLEPVKSEKLKVRDAYDHYLPKDTYPFNSVNFKNLVPACHTCNSSYKLVNDPIWQKKPGIVRRAFYPFAQSIPAYTIEVDVKKISSKNPKQNVVKVSLSSVTAKDEVDGWADVYKVKERYEDKCASEEVKDWIQRLMDDRKNYGHFDIKKYMAAKRKDAAKEPHINFKFLQIPFLDGYIKYTGFSNISTKKK